MAKVIGINPHKITGQTTVYDPTPGSGSLLLKVADEAGKSISIYGQENDNATRALAVMNMWLHGNPASEIVQGNTLASPQFTDESTGELYLTRSQIALFQRAENARLAKNQAQICELL